jgi:hypothetical protein
MKPSQLPLHAAKLVAKAKYPTSCHSAIWWEYARIPGVTLEVYNQAKSTLLLVTSPGEDLLDEWPPLSLERIRHIRVVALCLAIAILKSEGN